jgi:ferritin
MGMFDYLNERGGKIELLPIEKPVFEGKTPLEIFEEVLKHEQYVTSRINTVYDVAEEVKDRAAMKFLNWYIDEQVEEEASVDGVLSTLRLIGEDKNALLLLDKDLATRTFVAPVIG